MIWRLEYENAHGDVARLDIQRGLSAPVEIIEGTENPFLLSYELEGKNKKGFIMSSFADISIYETATFNIDDLKTLDETALSVKWYINSVLEWTGFVVPDFFSRTIGEPAIVNLAASDRLSALKGATLDGLGEYVKIKDLAIACLAKTGLSLPLITTVDFKANTTNIMNVFALSDRLEDDKGKKISCYDVLRSILVLTNSTIRQRMGQWRIYNKIQHEAVAPTLNFNEVYQGARRTIQPVFSSVGAFQEFGGGRRYPFNYDFNLSTGWTAKNGFSFIRDNREVLGYTAGTIYDKNRVPVFGDPTDNYQLVNNNDIPPFPATDIAGSPYLESSKIEIPYSLSKVNIHINLRASTTRTLFLGLYGSHGTYINFAVIAESASETLIMNKGGAFVPIENKWGNLQHVEYEFTDPGGTRDLITKETAFNGVLDVDGLVSDYKIIVRIYGSGGDTTTLIDSLSYSFSLDQDNGKGILYRTDQLGNFSKKNDPNTTIFGDHISSGLNGYFYPYSEDDNSILRIQANDDYLTSRWTTATDPAAGELPILQHVARQNSRMFGVAHNILSAVIDANTFDPLAVVSNCADERYVIVAATFDFLRSTVEVELQQIAYGTLERRDFIYSYFGGEDDGIRSIGAASSGGGTGIGGGGSFLDKYFTFDEGNDALIANVNLVSEKEIAAYFADGTLPSFWDDIPFATSSKVGGIKAASTYQNGIRINSNGFLEIDPSYADSGVSSWDDLEGKPTSFPPSSHNHTVSDVTGLQTALNGKLGTGAQAYDSARLGGQLASKYTRRDVNETITEDWNFTGNITAQGEVTAYSSSDARLKQNIKQIENALNIISKLNPVAFNWNDKAIELNENKDSERINYGVIAQELEKVLPELIHETNGYKSVDYEQVIMILAKGIQELKLEVEELKNK